MNKFTICLCLVFLFASGLAQPLICQDYLKVLTKNPLKANFSSLPIATIMYSGLTTNNPGQKYECEHKTPLSDPFHYFLIGLKNTTINVNTFTGLCVPKNCTKADIQKILINQFKWKNIEVFDYPQQQSNSLLIACWVILGIWGGVLVLSSLWTSFKEPVEKELIKKDEEISKPNQNEQEEAVNSLIQQRVQKKDEYKLFNFYQGYCKVYKKENQKPFLGSIIFLSALSLMFSTEFSYRQTIAANQIKSMKWFNSLGGVLFCNIEIAFSVIMFVLGAKLAFSFYKLSSFHEIGRYFFDQLLMKWLGLILATMTAYALLSLTDEPLNQIWKNNYGADCSSVMYQMWFLFRGFTMDCKVCLQWFWIIETDILLTIVAAPLFIVYRTKKWLGYTLFSLAIFISLIFGYGVLQNQNILFEPYKLFNMAKQFTVNYQSNTLVRIAPYAIGLLFGLFTSERKETQDSGNTQNELKVVKMIRRNENLQIVFHLLGLAVMALTYLLIIPYLPVAEPKQTRPQAHAYLVFSSFGYLLGLSFFLLPCLLKGESKLTVFLTRLLGASIWNSLQKMALGFIWMGPVVIGFTTYSMQNSIYFDFQTIFVYFLGDCAIIYILTLVAVSSIDNQLSSLSRWSQAKFFGNQSKYNVIVLED